MSAESALPFIAWVVRVERVDDAEFHGVAKQGQTTD